MSFIPHRDVFNMSEDEYNKADKLYDEVEAKWLDDFAADEFGKGWTFEMVHKEPHYKNWYPTISAWDMMIYMMNREK
jgi:hypothetical protein